MWYRWRYVVAMAGVMAFETTTLAAETTTFKSYELGYRTTIEKLAETVAQRTDGRIKVVSTFGFDAVAAALGADRLHGGEQMLIESVKRGDFEITATSTATLGSYVQEMQIVDLPFIFRDIAHGRAVLDKSIGAQLLATCEPAGVICIGWTENGMRELTTSVRPVRTPDDLKGLKIRVPDNDVYKLTFRTLGAEPVPTRWGPPLFEALASGEVNGQENALDTLASFPEIYKTQKYVSLTDHIYSLP